MRWLSLDFLLRFAIVSTASASGIVYITDLPAFSALAPCAADGVSYIVQSLTNSACPASVTALESCACTKDQNAAAVASRISSVVLQGCGSTATEDVASASVVFSGYCNQAATITTPPPSGASVSQYITDLSAYSTLAPCAADALSYIVQSLTNQLCPNAPSALASCACTKNQNSLVVSEKINSVIFQDCGTTHSEDVSSAQAVFAGYCGLRAGTTLFPTASALPGEVSYYITDLPSFSALAPCAASGLSYIVQSQTNHDCPAAARSLVSCACVKDHNSQALSSGISSIVNQDCGSTASEDVTSALGVFDYYCSAGKGLVTPQGITASAAASTRNNGQRTSSGYYYGPAATSTSGSGTFPTYGGSNPSTSGGGVSIPGIVAGAVGGSFILAITVWVIWLYRRRRRQSPPPVMSEGGHSHEYGKPELPAASITSGARGSPLSRKPVSNYDIQQTVSPISPRPETAEALGRAAELQSPWAPHEAEAPGDPSRHEMPGVHEAAELHHQHFHPELQGSVQSPPVYSGPVYEMPDHGWRG